MTQGRPRSGERGRGGAHDRGGSLAGPGGAREPARVTDGAARPAGQRQGCRADRSGDRARVFPCAAGLGGARKRRPNSPARSTGSSMPARCSRQGTAPHATYLFKHALVQDAAYGTLLREPRRALHARIAETLESQFADIAESQPELLARHCTEAGLIEKAAVLWGKAGQRSLARSALIEADSAIHPRARPDRGFARHAGAAARSRSSFRSRSQHRSSMSKVMRRRKPERPWSGHAC